MNINISYELGERLFYIKKITMCRGTSEYVIEDGRLRGINIINRKKQMHIQFQIKSENGISINNLFRNKEEAEAHLNEIIQGNEKDDEVLHKMISCFRP
ncbi:MAG TPA: hypothetical protein VF941_19500 [Clostridia bacterium]